MEKRIAIIAAVSANGVYGVDGGIPWRSKIDMEFFKEMTTGHTVVMGRKTWESLPDRFRPLPNRENFVITRQPGFPFLGAKAVTSIEEAIDKATSEKVFFIGGAVVWFSAMEYAHDVYVTVIDKEYVAESAGVSLVASDLLFLSERWPAFVLGSEPTIRTENIGGVDTQLTFNHWVQPMRA
jgi:dihydrofolate reductase